MSHLVALRDAIVASISESVTQFESVKAHGGDIDLNEINRVALRSPSAFVVCLGGRVRRHGGAAAQEANLAIFIICHGSSQTLRDSQVMALTEAVAIQVSNNAWAYEHAKAPEDISARNLFSSNLDRRAGVALWAVSWTQLVDASFDAEAYDALPLLHEVYVKTDLAPMDGVYEDEFAVLLNGTLMAVYGRLYVSTPLATSIAVVDTYQKAAGTTTLASPTADVDSPVAGRLRYTGTAEKPMFAQASVSIEVDADALVTLALAKNGVVDETSEVEQQCTVAGGPEAFSLNAVFNLDGDDYIEIWVKADDTIGVTLGKATLALIAT